METTFTRRRLLLLLVAGVQLVLAGMGAAQLRVPGDVGEAVDFYGTLSGANSGYGFFAPGVGSQLRGRFDVYLPDGRKETHPLESGVNHEADLRVGNILGWFWNDVHDRRLQRSLTASWAGKMFSRHPSATKVGVRLETYDLPTMERYRAGDRPFWKPYYEAKFVHKPKAPPAG